MPLTSGGLPLAVGGLLKRHSHATKLVVPAAGRQCPESAVSPGGGRHAVNPTASAAAPVSVRIRSFPHLDAPWPVPACSPCSTISPPCLTMSRC
ncbi:hypothetical protein G6F60_015203 [Rhizopus arrhizus]|nr:hypothetical protein G6F60_015203 [Rhizopus arrhizus]